MRTTLFASLSVLLLVACGDRRTGDETTPDLGRPDIGSAIDASSDAAALDSSTLADGASDATIDAPVTHDAGPVDLGGEVCGSSVCVTGVSYCCAAACNLCLPNAMFCLADPCAGVDAGPRDAGPPHDAGTSVICGGITCPAGDACMSCATPFGFVMRCLAPGMTCSGPVPAR